MPQRPQRCLAAGVVQVSQVDIEMAAQHGSRVRSLRLSRPALSHSPPPAETGKQRRLLQIPTGADSPVQIAEKRSNRVWPSARSHVAGRGGETVICPQAVDDMASHDAQLHVEEPAGLRQLRGVEPRVSLEIRAFQLGHPYTGPAGAGCSSEAGWSGGRGNPGNGLGSVEPARLGDRLGRRGQRRLRTRRKRTIASARQRPIR